MSETKLTKQQILEIHACLSRLNIQVGIKWGYAAARNKETLVPIVKAIQESQRFGKDREDYAHYEKERQGLIRSYSEAKAGGPKVVEDGRGALTRAVDPENYGAYLEAIEKLKEQYPDLIKDLEQHVADFEKSLQDTETVNIRIVKAKDVPLGLTQADYNVLLPMIEDPDAEP